MHITINISLTTCAFCLLLFTLAACSAKGEDQADVQAAAKSREAWFCQTDESGEEWECVQDDDLARSPVLERLPAAAQQAAVESTPAPGNSALPTIEEDLSDLTAAPEVGEETIEEQVVTRVADSAVAEPAGDLPAMDILELPEDFYAVQLLAMPNAEMLHSFIEKNDLQKMMAVRLARGTNLYYVLILGIYETAEIADKASSNLPATFEGIQPWIRKMGSLQRAIMRGDKLVQETAKEIVVDTNH
jgi:septal ring-binding cell division protein DamX